LQEQINSYIKSLKYDSNYYYPLFRKGYFEQTIIEDYLRSIGFKYIGSFSDVESYVLK